EANGGAAHQLVLRPLAAVEQHDAAVDHHGHRCHVAGARGQAGTGAEEDDAEVLHGVGCWPLSVGRSDSARPTNKMAPGAFASRSRSRRVSSRKGAFAPMFASVIHRITVTGFGALTSAIERPHRLRAAVIHRLTVARARRVGICDVAFAPNPL